MKVEKLIYFLSFLLSKYINRNNKNLPEFLRKILIIKLDEAGDMVYATPVFKLLKNAYPNAEITLYCKSTIKSLIKNDPNIDHIVTGLQQPSHRFDAIIDLRGNFKSLTFALINKPLIRLDRGSVRFKNKLKGGHPHELQTNFQIISPLVKNAVEIKPAIYTTEDDEITVDNFLHNDKLSKFAILHVGARKELRKWPHQKFAALTEYIKYQLKFDVIFVGDEQDIRDILTVQKLLLFKTYCVAGVFSWTQFATLAKKASIFIGNESGPLHVATAMETPVIGLFGPGESHVFYPVGVKATYIHHVLKCNPCNQITCIHPQNTCMQQILLEEVIEKIKVLNSNID